LVGGGLVGGFMIVGHRWRYPPQMTHDHGRRPFLRGRGIGEAAGALAWIPAGVSSRPAFMITKGYYSVRVKSLRREQSLRDHDGTGEVGYVLHPEFPI
jgi:hypothetical protein